MLLSAILCRVLDGDLFSMEFRTFPMMFRSLCCGASNAVHGSTARPPLRDCLRSAASGEEGRASSGAAVRATSTVTGSPCPLSIGTCSTSHGVRRWMERWRCVRSSWGLSWLWLRQRATHELNCSKASQGLVQPLCTTTRSRSSRHLSVGRNLRRVQLPHGLQKVQFQVPRGGEGELLPAGEENAVSHTALSKELR